MERVSFLGSKTRLQFGAVNASYKRTHTLLYLF